MTEQNDKQRLAELAPFYVAGTLRAEEQAAFEAALARDGDLARNVGAARAERDAILALNEALPAPSARAGEKLFAALDAEPRPAPSLTRRFDLGARLAEFFSPRALGWIAAAACLLVAVEAGFLAVPSQPGSGSGAPGFSTASQGEASRAGHTALVAFAPEAGVAKVAELLAQNGVEIIEGPRAGGFFRVRLGGPEASEAESIEKLEALRASGLLRFAEQAP